MNQPPDLPQPQDLLVKPNAPEPDRGSLLIGFLLGWAVLIGSLVLDTICVFAISMLGSAANILAQALIGLAGLLPFGAMLALLVWFMTKGKTRSAAGVGLTFASLFALALLLVAACFGLLAGTNFH